MGVNKRYPQDIFMRLGTAGGTALNEEDTAPYINAVEEDTGRTRRSGGKSSGLPYVQHGCVSGRSGFSDRPNQVSQIGMGNGEIRSVYVIRLEDYNTISGSSAELGDNEVFIYPYKMNYDYDTVDFEGLGTWKAEKLDTEPFCIGEADANALGSLFLVVKDISVMDQMCEVKNESLAGEWTSSIQRCYGFDLACGDEKQSEIYNGIMERFHLHGLRSKQVHRIKGSEQGRVCCAVRRTVFPRNPAGCGLPFRDRADHVLQTDLRGV